jgi:transposase InsO family protein
VATYKTELVQQRLLSYERLEHETLEWIGFYNTDRLHEELGDTPPGVALDGPHRRIPPAGVETCTWIHQPRLHQTRSGPR